MNFDLKTSKIKDRDSEEKTFKTVEFQYFKSPEKRKTTYLNPTFLKYSSFI